MFGLPSTNISRAEQGKEIALFLWHLQSLSQEQASIGNAKLFYDI
jgi:hypothetical protein